MSERATSGGGLAYVDWETGTLVKRHTRGHAAQMMATEDADWPPTMSCGCSCSRVVHSAAHNWFTTPCRNTPAPATAQQQQRAAQPQGLGAEAQEYRVQAS